MGLASSGPVAEILATIAPALLGYDLTTATGPIIGLGVIRSDATFATTLGDFNLTSIGATTFQATIPSELPLPPAIALFASGLGLMGLIG